MLQLHKSDHAKHFKLSTGSQIVITLEENPTTGFRWALDPLDANLLQLVSSTYKSEATPQIAGSGGTRTITLATLHPGHTSLKLKLRREWEGDASAIDRWEIELDIR